MVGAPVALAMVIVSVALASTPGEADASTKNKVISYVIDDPNLLKHPDTVSGELQRAGDLDRLGVKPAIGGKPSEITGKKALAATPATYMVDSARFPGGVKPDDPYQYTNFDECAANVDLAGQDAGWIKNRYSYCQQSLAGAVAIFEANADSPQGGMRFDTAWYLTPNRAEQLGSVFDRAVPGFAYRRLGALIMGRIITFFGGQYE